MSDEARVMAEQLEMQFDTSDEKIEKLININRKLYDELVEAREVFRQIGESLREYKPVSRLPDDTLTCMRLALSQAAKLDQLAEAYDEVG